MSKNSLDESLSLFTLKEDLPVWFVGVEGKHLGPFKASEIYNQLQTGEVLWVHHIWKSPWREWKRICDVKLFSSTQPKAPKAEGLTEIKKQIKETTKTLDRLVKKRWFVHTDGNQYGPFDTAEIERLYKIGKIKGDTFIWAEGMAEWKKLGAVAELLEFVQIKPEVKPAGRREKRKSPRVPLVAKILVAHQDQVMSGVCRDLSVGGMQVLTDFTGSEEGDKIRLNVSPVSVGESDQKTLKSFVAHGVVVRKLEGGRGFSFRFEKLGDSAKRIIEEYISKSS